MARYVIVTVEGALILSFPDRDFRHEVVAVLAVVLCVTGLSACSPATPTDPQLRTALLDAEGPITADAAFARSQDMQFICISSGTIRPDDHLRALQAKGFLTEAPSGDPFPSASEIGAFEYDITVFSEDGFQVYPINAEDIGWPHASVGCYYAEGFQIGVMDAGEGTTRVVTKGERVHEREYWRE